MRFKTDMTNHVILFGSIGKPPQYSVNAVGTPHVKFSLAVRKKEKGSKDIHWIQCESYGELATIIKDGYGKGDFMLVKDGEVQTTTYKDGRQYWVIRVRQIEFAVNRKTPNKVTMEKYYGEQAVY